MNKNDAAFIERISAEATHEIMNGLASVGQAAGLMSDLIAMGLCSGGGLLAFLGLKKKTVKTNSIAKMKKALGSLRTGMDKSKETSRALNRFMHGMTPSDGATKAGQISADLIILMRRSAKQKKIELKQAQIPDELAVDILPYNIHRALAACVEELKEAIGMDGTITFSCSERDAMLVFGVSAGASVSVENPSQAFHEAKADTDAAGVSISIVANGFEILVPRAASGA
jgi:hypothetical protein